jgi:DNA mismatch endonuclease, patch repair protein
MSLKKYRGKPFPHVSEERRRTMASIRGKDTKPELAVRSLLHRLGYRYRLHKRGLPGSPDVVFPSRRKVIFVHGCFWHCHQGCKLANTPKTRTDYWGPKLQANTERDRRIEQQLLAQGWKTAVIWECEASDVQQLQKKLRTFIGPPGTK